MKGFSVTNFRQSLQDGSDSDKMPSYEGNDPCFQEEPWCATCHSRPASGLLCYSLYHAAWYCNSQCQKVHYNSGHKKMCCVRCSQSVPLRNMRRDFHKEPQDWLFWNASWNLSRVEWGASVVETYVQAANVTEIKNVWEKTLFHALELLTLDATGCDSFNPSEPAPRRWYFWLYVTREGSILNPVPLITSNCPRELARGEPSEALSLLFCCARCFVRVPGAKEMLEQRFEQPSNLWFDTVHGPLVVRTRD